MMLSKSVWTFCSIHFCIKEPERLYPQINNYTNRIISIVMLAIGEYVLSDACDIKHCI